MEQHNGEANGSGGGGGSAYLCRPSGTRWIPTSEQIRILRELYYSCGIRSPNSEQIQRIAAMLRQYGKIEGKNVFYWFQNHKARERQKKRLTTLDVPPPSAAADDSHAQLLSPSHANGVMAPSSPSTVYTSNGAVPMETSAWDSHGPAVAERSFLDCLGVRSTTTHTTAPTSWAYLSDQTARRAMPRELETLPLFPISDSRRPRHGDQEEQCQETSHGCYLSGFQCWGASTAPSNQQQQLMQLQEQHQYYSSSSNQLSGDDAAAAAGTSLELTLSSYCCPYPAGSM